MAFADAKYENMRKNEEIKALFDHLESGISMEDFLTDFPSVTKEQVFTLIALVGKVLSKEILYSPR